MSSNITDRIKQFNKCRNPKLLELKYKLMSKSVFSFYRGTCHLFYEDLPKKSPLNIAPPVWVCGDLHLENFGSYKGDNRLVYFDINDFDESSLAPCTWDLARFVTSILVGYETLQINESQALDLSNLFLDVYIKTLAKGQSRSVEKETAKGLVEDLLIKLEKRDRADFLDKFTKDKKGKRQLTIDDERIIEATETQQKKVEKLIHNWQKSTGKDEKFYEVLDVQQRIAGTGSLGLERYLILVEGKGSPDQNYLLDLKEARTSSLQSYLTVPQPEWSSPATRIIAIQKRVQYTSPALLAVITDGNKSYVLRELQPSEDKVKLEDGEGKMGRLEKLIQSMGEVTAWDQLRSGGRQGSAIADDLINFAFVTEWRDRVLEYSYSYSKTVVADHYEFHKHIG